MNKQEIESLETQLLKLNFEEVTISYTKTADKTFIYSPSNPKIDGSIVVKSMGNLITVRTHIKQDNNVVLDHDVSKVIKCVVEQIEIIENLSPSEYLSQMVLEEHVRVHED
jgi:hypothetical protein